jgi:hypothetical protein
VLALVEVPQHGDTVLSTGGGERSIGRNGEGVDVTSVAVVVGLQLALVELPDLYKSALPSTSARKGRRQNMRDQRSWWIGCLIGLPL